MNIDTKFQKNIANACNEYLNELKKLLIGKWTFFIPNRPSRFALNYFKATNNPAIIFKITDVRFKVSEKLESGIIVVDGLSQDGRTRNKTIEISNTGEINNIFDSMEETKLFLMLSK